VDEILSSLKIELSLRKNELMDQTVETIYFGGGTPSLLSADELGMLIDEVHRNYPVIENPEITIEANPDDLLSVEEQSRNIFEKYLDIGINRLSIGIQSFFDDDLQSMNRAHSANEAKECLKIATKYFDNITIDLIYGIPNMSLEKWKKNLRTAFSFGVPHISSYALTVEPKTALDTFIKKGIYPPIDDELALDHFDLLVSETEKKGFVHYEISNFGKPDFFSKHNTSYWQGRPYLGIGPSAHSFIGNQRSWNVSNNSKYIQSIKQNKLPSKIEELSKKDRFNEYVMTGLRTIWGVSLYTIENEFGSEYKESLEKSSEKYINDGLLYKENQILKTTKRGKFLADGIASDLFMI
jgi:oxygen-independent coproporphyrinogen-3 oxidase